MSIKLFLTRSSLKVTTRGYDYYTGSSIKGVRYRGRGESSVSVPFSPNANASPVIDSAMLLLR